MVSLKSQSYRAYRAHTFNSQGEEGGVKKNKNKQAKPGYSPRRKCEENKKIQKSYKQIKSLAARRLETTQTLVYQSTEK